MDDISHEPGSYHELGDGERLKFHRPYPGPPDSGEYRLHHIEALELQALIAAIECDYSTVGLGLAGDEREAAGVLAKRIAKRVHAEEEGE